MNSKFRRFTLRFLKKMTFLPANMYVGYMYEYFTGKKLNLKDPKEFNEKIQWYKVFYQPDILTQLADKYEVRSYVKEKIGEEYLNQLLGVYNKASEVNFDELPNEFILKATHSSSHNLIVHDKSKVNKFEAKKKFYKWLHTNQYYRTGQEWAYKNIPPRIIAEKLLKEEAQPSLIDYKFYCFNGEAKFICVHIGRFNDHKKVFFDTDFNQLPYSTQKTLFNGDVKKPNKLKEMVCLANKLADRLPFVRVDFYLVNDKITFGEMTFYPGDGKLEFHPNEYNRIIGDYLKLPEIPKGEKRITKI